MVHNISSFGVINTLVYDGWGGGGEGGQISIHAQIWSPRSKKNAKRIFYIFDLLNYKKQSKYRFRQLVHTELQY